MQCLKLRLLLYDKPSSFETYRGLWLLINDHCLEALVPWRSSARPKTAPNSRERPLFAKVFTACFGNKKRSLLSTKQQRTPSHSVDQSAIPYLGHSSKCLSRPSAFATASANRWSE